LSNSSALKGNPHARYAEAHADTMEDWMGSEGITDATMIAVALDAQTQAALAVAYEQRTVALLAYSQHPLATEEDRQEAQQEAWQRLGLGVR
jgi:purine-nucleoside phosphorylase